MIVLPPAVVRDSQRKPITASLLPTDVGDFQSAASHYIDRRVGISAAIVIHCVRGHGWAIIGPHRYEIHEDEVLIVPPRVAHAYGASETKPWTIYWAHVVGTHVVPLLNALNIQPACPIVPATDSTHLIATMEQVLHALDSSYTHASLTVASLAMSHFFGLLLSNRGASAKASDLEDRINDTIEYLKRSIGGSIRVSELAAMAKVSPSHYAVLFKKRTGCSVLDFFIREKMREACRLLEMTHLPIKAIADQLAYDDALYFSRVFHRVMGLPPREYREQRKGIRP